LIITTHTTNNTHYTGLGQTSGRFNLRYGYTEARIKCGDEPGMWSAFWMWIGTMTTVDDVSVHGAEIDICEHQKVDANGNNHQDTVFAGTLTLSGSNAFSSGVAVNGGVLQLANTIGSGTGAGPVTVAAGATIAGPGSASGDVTVNGTIAPGANVGTLTTGSQTWPGGGVYAWEVNHATNHGGWDSLAINGTLNVAATPAGKFTVKVISLNGGAPGEAAGFDPLTNYTWIIAIASGGITGFDPNAFAVDARSFRNTLAGGAFTVEPSGNSMVLKFHANAFPPQFTGASVRGGVFQLGATGVPGKTYGLETATNLTPPVGWLALTNLTADLHGLLLFSDPDAAQVGRRFYRISAP
jgi:autotransporter-associated beta strand protein